MNPNKPTVTITITGPSGSGKTQVSKAIAFALRDKGLPVQLTDDIHLTNRGRGTPQVMFENNDVLARPNIVINVETP